MALHVVMPSYMNCYINIGLLLSCITVFVSADIYYATPTKGTRCPEEGVPCMTLSQYANKPTGYFASNATLIILPGNHGLSTQLSIANIINLEILANASEPQVMITCDDSAMFNLEEITQVRISNLVTIGCSANRATSVDHFILEHSSIQGSGDGGTGLILENFTNASIVTCNFTKNTGSKLNFESHDLGFGGGAIISYASYVSIVTSVFQDNSVADVNDHTNTVREGGAIYAWNSIIMINNSTFINNSANVGGAITAYYGYVSIMTSIFQYNSVADVKNTMSLTQKGGAICSWNSTVTANSSTFTNNSANVGGAIFVFEDRFSIIDNSSFTGNVAIAVGGAITINYGGVEIADSSFNFNLATGGGVLELLNSEVTIENGTFYNNKALIGGGVLGLVGQSEARIGSSAFFFNEAGGTQSGGGVAYISASTLVFEHSVFINNIAFFGGVVYAVGSYVKEDNCTYSKNVAIKQGNTYNLGSTSTFESKHSSYIDNNALVDDASLFVSVNGSSSTFEHTTFSNNLGNGLIIFSSNATFYDCTFESNEFEALVHNASFVLAIYDGIVIVMNCSFINNTANSGVVFIALNSGVLTENSVFSDNKPTDINSPSSLGGAVFVGGYSEYVASQCIFRNNMAGTGGAISAVTNGNIEVKNTLFFNNTANFGGAITCGDSGHPNPTLTLTNTTFTHNKGGAIGATSCTIQSSGYLSIQNNTGLNLYGVMYALQESSITFSGTVTIADNQGSILVFASNITFDGEATLTNNTITNTSNGDVTTDYQQGGTITAIQSTLHFSGSVLLKNNKAQNGGAVLIIESQLYTEGMLTIASNTGTSTGGGIYAYLSQLNFVGKGLIQANEAVEKGGGIHAVGTAVVLSGKGSLQFIENSAAHGGGIFMEKNSKIYINKEAVEMQNCSHIPNPSPIACNNNSDTWLRLEFTRNSAHYGGAVYIDDGNSDTCESTSISTTGECFIQTLKLYLNLQLPKKDLLTLNQANTYFTDNTATEAGVALYGGLLDRCTIDQFGEQLLLVNYSYPKLNLATYIFNITDIKNNSISSDPARVCFCRDDLPDCNYKPPAMYVNKGLKFGVTVVAVDQVNHTLPATIHSSLSSQSGGLGDGQASQNTFQTCTQLEYSIRSPLSSEQVFLYAEGPCKDVGISRNSFHVVFHPCSCPIGFQVLPTTPDCNCDCDLAIKPYVINCTYINETILKESDVWISYINDTDLEGYIIYPHCPFDYCYPSTKPVYINLNIPNGADAQCDFNRTKKLCGSCKHGLSLSLGSSRCMSCSNDWLALLILFALAGLALVAFLLVLNLTVAVGTINGLIFYANIIAANRAIFFPFKTPNVLTVFISWLNLDLGLETCFYHGMDGYAKTWLQLVFPIYVILLVVATIIIGDYSTRFAKLLTGKNPVATLATLILLSYTKLLRVIIAALSFATLDYPDGSRETVWLFDANVPYLKGKHIPLFLAAFIIILVGLSYTLLLFFWQWILRLPRRKTLRMIQNTKFYAFMDTYHAPHFPDNTKHRYWTGLLLLVRVLLYLVPAMNVNGDPRINLLCISSVTVGLFALQHFSIRYLDSWIYNSWVLDVIESSYFFNLIVFSGATFYVSETNQDQAVLAYISTSIAFVTFVAIIIYHLYKFTFKSMIQKLINILKNDRSQRPLQISGSVQVDPNININDRIAGPGVSHTEIDGLPPNETNKNQPAPKILVMEHPTTNREELQHGGAESDETTLLLSHSQKKSS